LIVVVPRVFWASLKREASISIVVFMISILLRDYHQVPVKASISYRNSCMDVNLRLRRQEHGER
jgi:hypothetical protein